jgi:hypothetical protein
MTQDARPGNDLLSPNPPRARLLSFRAVPKNTLRGFAHIALPIGLEILDIVIGESNGHAWALFPSKPVIGPDGIGERRWRTFAAVNEYRKAINLLWDWTRMRHYKQPIPKRVIAAGRRYLDDHASDLLWRPIT